MTQNYSEAKKKLQVETSSQNNFKINRLKKLNFNETKIYINESDTPD
jgi:hypothetical protein